MKRILITTLLVLAVLSTSCNTELFPKALAVDTQNIVRDVKSDNDEIFKAIQDNIDLVAELKSRVQQAQIDGKPLPLTAVIKDIETITVSYETLAGQKDEIKKQLLQKIADVDSMRNMVSAEINILKTKKADYEEQLRAVNDSDPEISRARKEALTKAIGYVDAQIQLWIQFDNTEGNIITEMSDIQNRIDEFLSMIESTAIVFREGLNLLYLQRDIDEALALFSSDIPTMEQLTSDMERSWDTLDYLLETLTGIANIGIN